MFSLSFVAQDTMRFHWTLGNSSSEALASGKAGTGKALEVSDYTKYVPKFKTFQDFSPSKVTKSSSAR